MEQGQQKVVVEFVIKDGKKDELMAALQKWDESEAGSHVIGYRADDFIARREALVRFVDQMELKLRKNDHKRNWREQSLTALFRLLLLEIEETKVAMEFFTPDEVRTELVDVANFSMILWDRLSMLDQNQFVREGKT